MFPLTVSAVKAASQTLLEQYSLVHICRRHACGGTLAVSQVLLQTSSRCVADKPQTCRRHFAVSCRRQGEGTSFVRHFHPVYSVRSFRMTQGCLRQPPTSIHIEKNHRRSSKRARKHRRQTGRVELNSTSPVCRPQGPGHTVALRGQSKKKYHNANKKNHNTNKKTTTQIRKH